MDVPPSDVLAAAIGAEVEPSPLEPVTAALIPLADGIRNTLASISLIPVAQATPEQRTQLVRIRDEIDRIARDATTWLDAIDLSFRHAAVALGARQIPLADGVVTVEPARGEWKVDVAGLRSELTELSGNGGQISLEEIASIFTTVVTEKADNNRLNYFGRQRGEELAAIVERHRRLEPGNPMSAKVRFQRRAE